jgi:hypothetical protein
LSHKPAREEKNGRRRNRTESIERDRDILWKTFAMSSQRRYTALRDGKSPGEYGVVRLIHSQAATRHGGSAGFASDNCARVTGCAGSLRADEPRPVDRVRGHGPLENTMARKHHISKTLWLEIR